MIRELSGVLATSRRLRTRRPDWGGEDGHGHVGMVVGGWRRTVIEIMTTIQLFSGVGLWIR